MENRIFKRQPTKKDASDFSRQLDLVSDEAQAEEQKFLRSVDHDDELQDLRSKLLDATEALENAALEHPLVQEQRSRILLDKNVDPDRAFIQTERFIFLDNTHLFEHDFLDRLIHLRLQREWLWSIFQCRLWSHKKHDALLQAEDKVTSLFRG